MQVRKDKTITLKVTLPVMPGCISTAMSTCGRPNCACQQTPPKLHGVYYRWTGWLDGKRTTKTLSKEVAQECQRRIENYHRVLRQLEKFLAQGLARAPWKGGAKVKP
jgi:hypothetical protein